MSHIFRVLTTPWLYMYLMQKKIETKGYHVRDAVIYKYVLSYDDLKQKNWAISFPETYNIIK